MRAPWLLAVLLVGCGRSDDGAGTGGSSGAGTGGSSGVAGTSGSSGAGTGGSSGVGGAGGAGGVAACPEYERAERVGTVENPEITEISGLVASQRHADVLWTHNDSGDEARVFALTTAGKDLGEFALSGAQARDWEDMALAPDPNAAADVLWLADFGDNAEMRPFVTLYRVSEPVVSASGGDQSATLDGVDAFELEYPDGPHNAETLLADPSSGALYIVVKAESGESSVYRTVPQNPGSRATLEHVHTIQLGTEPLSGSTLATGGDVRGDGLLIAVRTYNSAFAWRRAPSQSVAEALAGDPCRIFPAAEPQGEAFAFSADGAGFFTISEGSSQPVYLSLPTN